MRLLILVALLSLFTISDLFAKKPIRILPAELISFNVESVKDTFREKLYVILEWETASELNTDKFVIERTNYVDNVKQDYEEIGEVKASGNSHTLKEYSFRDTLILHQGTVFYRLKILEFNGDFDYSDERVVDTGQPLSSVEGNTTIVTYKIENIYPNPVGDIFLLNYTLFEPNHVEIHLYDLKGNDVITPVTYFQGPGKYSIPINMSGLVSKKYYILIKVGNYTETKKILFLK